MAKLHEVLAVESDLEGKAKRIVAEAKDTFAKKPHLFQGKVRTLSLFRGDDEVTKKAAESAEAQNQVLATTVHDKLQYVWESIVAHWNAVAQKETTNQAAKADIVVDGHTIARGVPVTFLLSLESKLQQLRELYEQIPTLEPNIKWEQAPELGHNVMIAPAVTTLKTQKETDYRTIAPATDKHQAQVVAVEKVANVGAYTDLRTSGLVTPAKKSDWLENIDTLRRAVKQARQRANEEPLIDSQIAASVMNFIHGDEFTKK
jgi:hypothetical protein